MLWQIANIVREVVHRGSNLRRSQDANTTVKPFLWRLGQNGSKDFRVTEEFKTAILRTFRPADGGEQPCYLSRAIFVRQTVG